MSRKKSNALAIALVFIANLVTFSFSSEALADSLLHNGGAYSQEDSKQGCNHGCHAAGHFQGNIAENTLSYNPFSVPSPVSRSEALALGESITELYRPPRSLRA